MGDEQTGIDIVTRALEGHQRLIAANAGREDAMVMEKVRNNNNAHKGGSISLNPVTVKATSPVRPLHVQVKRSADSDIPEPRIWGVCMIAGGKGCYRHLHPPTGAIRER